MAKKPTKKKEISNEQANINELLYLLRQDAKRNREIENLLIERDAAIKEAYSFSYGVVNWHPEECFLTGATEYVALEIIRTRDLYEKRIRRCRVRHERFKTITDALSYSEAETLIKAFCTDLEVDEEVVKVIIRKNYLFIKSHYPEE